jgi:hypothetical protein
MDMLDVYAMENEIKDYHENNTRKLAHEHVLRSGGRAEAAKLLLYALAVVAVAAVLATGALSIP